MSITKYSCCITAKLELCVHYFIYIYLYMHGQESKRNSSSCSVNFCCVFSQFWRRCRATVTFYLCFGKEHEMGIWIVRDSFISFMNSHGLSLDFPFQMKIYLLWHATCTSKIEDGVSMFSNKLKIMHF